MVRLIVAAIILIVIMLVFVFILFKNIMKSINENAKKYFVNKLHDYDYILEEKQKKLEEVRTEINSLKEHKNIINNQPQEIQVERKETKDKEKNITPIKYNLKTPEYRETQFFNNYKEVKKIFSVDNENIIKNFIEEHKNKKEQKQYNDLKKLREKFDDDAIYGCLTLNVENQIKILDEVLTESEKKLINFNEEIKNKNFSIKYFIKDIDNKMDELDPTIYIYTNGMDKKYDLIDKNIVMRQYNNMSEGIIIKFRNKIYDYSI